MDRLAFDLLVPFVCLISCLSREPVRVIEHLR
jgi:hypothetical protein